MEQFAQVAVFFRESNALITQTDVFGQTLKLLCEDDSNSVFSQIEQALRADEASLRKKAVAYENTK